MWERLVSFLENLFGVENEERAAGYLNYYENEFYWADDGPPPTKAGGVSAWIWALLAFWLVFFVIGMFTTPIIDGKPEVTPIPLRLERAYIKNIQADLTFSDNLASAVRDLGQRLEKKEIDSFTFSAELNSILDAIDKKMGALKTTKPPERFNSLHRVVLEMFNYQAMAVQELSAYVIDNDPGRAEKIKSFTSAYRERRDRLGEQMEVIRQNLKLTSRAAM